MPKELYGFDLNEAPKGVSVHESTHVKPRTGEEAFQKSENTSFQPKRTDHGDLGGLGDRQFSEKAKR